MPTPFESASLNLRLFDVRREPVLREARDWMKSLHYVVDSGAAYAVYCDSVGRWFPRWPFNETGSGRGGPAGSRQLT